MNSEKIIIIENIDEYGIVDDVDESLREDNISESCYTSFQDALTHLLIHEVREKVQDDDWKLKAFEKNKEEKIFNAFMENGEIKVLLSRRLDGQKNEYKKVIVKFSIPEDKKKKVAETYVNTILEGYYYLDMCILVNLDEVNVDTISKALSGEVYGLLSPEEIKAKFGHKIKEAIDVINDNVDYEENYNDDE